MDSGVRVSLRPEETPLSKAELLRELARREKIHESRVKFKVTLQGARAQSEQWLAEALAAQALSPNAEADTEVFNCRHNIDNYTASIERTTDLIASAKDGVSEARHAVWQRHSSACRRAVSWPHPALNAAPGTGSVALLL